MKERSWLLSEQHRRRRQQCARDRDALPLASGDCKPALTHARREALWQRRAYEQADQHSIFNLAARREALRRRQASAGREQANPLGGRRDLLVAGGAMTRDDPRCPGMAREEPR